LFLPLSPFSPFLKSIASPRLPRRSGARPRPPLKIPDMQGPGQSNGISFRFSCDPPDRKPAAPSFHHKTVLFTMVVPSRVSSSSSFGLSPLITAHRPGSLDTRALPRVCYWCFLQKWPGWSLRTLPGSNVSPQAALGSFAEVVECIVTQTQNAMHQFCSATPPSLYLLNSSLCMGPAPQLEVRPRIYVLREVLFHDRILFLLPSYLRSFFYRRRRPLLFDPQDRVNASNSNGRVMNIKPPSAPPFSLLGPF